ncbi:DUF6790 family protein [Kribbella sp. NPDC055071]
MDTTAYVVTTVFPVVPILVAVIGARIRTRHSSSPQAALETWQRGWAIATLGAGSLAMSLSFFVVPQTMATEIGFTDSPFAFEIACANLGLAVMGFRAASASASARERVTIGLGAGMFLWGATLGHLYQFFAKGDHQPGNTGGILIYDVLIPAVMIILAVRSQRLARTTSYDAQPLPVG